MDPKEYAHGFAQARSENEFWLVFEDVCREAQAWPGGLAVLSTPCVPMATLFFTPKSRTLTGGMGTVLRQLIDDEGAVFLEQDLTVRELGDLRRDVRAGRYTVRLRDAQHRWHDVTSGATTGQVFTEPMLPGRELGLVL